jgi:hypothetical protein
MTKHLVDDFIAYWSAASTSERSNSQRFLVELCDLLDVPRPDNHPANGYFFEYPVTEHHVDGTTSPGWIDLCKRGCFVLESKQFLEAKAKASPLERVAEQAGVIERKKSSHPVRGTGAWDDAMTRARGQAERYVRALPASEPNPPFILVVDVGHSFELFADFSQAGKAYLPFPDPRTFRIRLADLADPKIRERLRLVWTNPVDLDPAKRSADVTREVSAHLAELAKSLEEAGHHPEIVAQFLTRCLFCMFAEDVGLLPDRAFTELLASLPADGTGFQEMVGQLFHEMNTGTGQAISVILRKKLLQFNGGLFNDDTALPMSRLQLGLLKEASRQNWASVEPAIFGTLLERALNPGERHDLGAHFTPRVYVERLVLPTIIEPLRTEWENVRAAAITHARADDLRKARAAVNAFHAQLCNLKVLDPACGTGNFLYVSLQQLKVLEGEVLDLATQFGDNFKLELETHTVDPHQFLGIEINPRAAAIAELVLWIGYLQWHFKLHGTRTPREPILRAFKNIECRDAVLAYEGDPQPARDEAGKEITVWDRKSTKTAMATGREVPDETKRVPLFTYANPRPAEWPATDYIVGNPPFIGNARMREDLGDGYAETLRATYPDVPESADLVLYWWYKAAELVRAGKVKRFGLITTNSLRQTFARRVVQAQLTAEPPLSLIFAIPDHPWVDAADGAAVRIAMTVGVAGVQMGELLVVKDERVQSDGAGMVTLEAKKGRISGELTIGPSISGTIQLQSNEGLSNTGVKLHGSGFIVTPDRAAELGLGTVPGLEQHIRPYRHGRDLNDAPRGVLVIDLDGLDAEEVRQRFPSVYQHVLTTVKPERDHNNERYRRENWWLFGRRNTELRSALAGLPRYIATAETSKHRFFQFLDSRILPDNMLVAIALADAFALGVLSSRIHVTFALAAGGRLGVGNDPRYNKSRCFDPFPFPLCSDAEKECIRGLGEELDAHRKRVQAQHGLTLTGLYNVLEKLRANESLDETERLIHDQGLVSVLKQLHDELDVAVFAAYGWPVTLIDAEILERVFALNADRAAEEARGVIHWLRPEYQTRNRSPEESGQKEMEWPGATAQSNRIKAAPASRKAKQPWPKTLAERVQAVELTLHGAAAAITAAELAKHFSRANAAEVAEILDTLVTLGRARKNDQRFTR